MNDLIKPALFAYITISALFGALIIFDYYQPRNTYTQTVKDMYETEKRTGRSSHTKYYIETDNRKFTVPFTTYNSIHIDDTVSITTSSILNTLFSVNRLGKPAIKNETSFFTLFPLIPICCMLPLFAHLFYYKKKETHTKFLIWDFLPFFAIVMVNF